MNELDEILTVIDKYRDKMNTVMENIEKIATIQHPIRKDKMMATGTILGATIDIINDEPIIIYYIVVATKTAHWVPETRVKISKLSVVK